ncbi:hypothetical protein BH23GEM4_BH23GEM4_21370 [soil metagenome]
MTPAGTFPEPLRPAVSRPTSAEPSPQVGATLPPFAGGETLPAGPQADAEDLLPDIVADAERPEPLPRGPSTVEEKDVEAAAAPSESSLEDYPDWLDETLGLAPMEESGTVSAAPVDEPSAPAADRGGAQSDADDLPDWLEETLGAAGNGEEEMAEAVAESAPVTEDEDFPDWLEQTLATVETHGDVGVAAEPADQSGDGDADLLDVSELLGEPEPQRAPEPLSALTPESAAGGAAEQVAERLERIARTLRAGGVGALHDASDPLALLVTGFVLGYEQRERGG